MLCVFFCFEEIKENDSYHTIFHLTGFGFPSAWMGSYRGNCHKIFSMRSLLKYPKAARDSKRRSLSLFWSSESFKTFRLQYNTKCEIFRIISLSSSYNLDTVHIVLWHYTIRIHIHTHTYTLNLPFHLIVKVYYGTSGYNINIPGCKDIPMITENNTHINAARLLWEQKKRSFIVVLPSHFIETNYRHEFWCIVYTTFISTSLVFWRLLHRCDCYVAESSKTVFPCHYLGVNPQWFQLPPSFYKMCPQSNPTSALCMSPRVDVDIIIKGFMNHLSQFFVYLSLLKIYIRFHTNVKGNRNKIS